MIRKVDASRLRIRLAVASFAYLSLLGAGPANADDGDSPPPRPLQPRRYELAGFPIIGGSTDIGVQFGVALTWTRFYEQILPYDWNVDLLLSASLKDIAGVQLVQQSHVLRLDAPNLFGGRVRIDTRASFQRTINAGYYGLGDASAAPLPPSDVSSDCATRWYQYTQEEGRVRSIGRVHTSTVGFDIAIGANLRVETPSVYSASDSLCSRLEQDVAAQPIGGPPAVVGSQPAVLGGLSAGVMIDTRDSEFVTRRGIYYQVAVGTTVGSAEGVAYGETSAVLAHYAPLGGPFVFASRVVASFQFGRVPFYDLQQGGNFEPQYLFGSENGVRGVPQGRYAGPVKMLTNLEIRSTPFPRFNLLGQRFRIGTTTFFDAGRVWDQYSAISRADGTSLRLKFGLGGGLFLQWGEAAIFRIEAAYSPDAVSENPKLPIGLYVSDGLMF
jgi:hypothetical protein